MNTSYNQNPRLDPQQEIIALPATLPARPQSAAEGSDVTYLMAAVRRQRSFIVIVACLCFAITCAALFLVTPVYESKTTIVIDPPGSEAFSLQSATQGLSEPDYIETQAHVLKGEGLAIDVVRQMKLDQNPVVMKKDFVARLKEITHFNQLMAALRHKVRPRELSDDTHLTASEATALDYVTSHLTVSPVKNSRVIEVSFKSSDAELSSEIANTLVSLYVTENYATRYEAVMKSSEWLSRQLDDIRAKAVASHEALANYQKEYGIAEVDDKQNTVSEREGELVRQYTQAEAERIQMESYLARVRQGDAASVPQFRANPVTQQITEKLVELKGQLSQAEVSYGENHPSVARLKNEIVELQNQLQTQEQAISKEITAGFAAASSREHQLQGEVKRTTVEMSQMSGYAVLRREAQANQDLYDALYARVKEAGISAASKSSNITIADKARVLDSPTWPRLTLMLPIAFLVSWIGGAAAGLLRDSVDRSVRSSHDVPNMHSNQALVLVPDFNPKQSLSFARDRARLWPPRKAQDHGLNKFMLGRLDSPEAESLQSLSSTVMLAHRQSRLKAFLVTSPLPQEGKTTLSYNLAIALAANGKTCFLNADLRKGGNPIEPEDHEFAGITDYCKGKATLKEIETQSEDHPELTVVHSGRRKENATQVLMSNRFQDLVTELRARYEFLIIDSPPILPFADACFLGALCDGAIVVARSSTTNRESLEQAMEKLYLLAVPVLGVALNGVSVKELPYRRYHARVGVK